MKVNRQPALLLTSRKRTILALRGLLILATMAVPLTNASWERMWTQLQSDSSFQVYLGILLVYFLVTFGFAMLPPARFAQTRSMGAILLFDLVVMSLLALYGFRATKEFYVLFYIVVLLAAFTRSIVAALAIGLATGAIYWILSATTSGGQPLTGTEPFSSAFNIRLAFFFVLALFSTYMAMELRRGSDRALEAFDDLFDHSTDGLVLCDSKGVILRVNQEAEGLFGQKGETLHGQEVMDFLQSKSSTKEEVATKILMRTTGAARVMNVTLNPKPDQSISCEVRDDFLRLEGKPHRLITIRDVSQMREVQVQLMHMERLAAGGRLMAGIVHQVRNALTSASGYSQLLMQNLSEEPSQKWATSTHEGIKRAEEIVNSFLEMAKAREVRAHPVRVNEILDKVKILVEPQTKEEQTRLVLNKDTFDSMVRVDPIRLEECLLILANNGLHAMRSLQSKVLTITASSASTEAPCVRIVVTDTGGGILPEHLPKIFKPFFTTKGPEEGSGLGLAICNTLVTLHGGRIDVDSAVGKGTSFIITLPMYSGKESAEHLKALRAAASRP